MNIAPGNLLRTIRDFTCRAPEGHQSNIDARSLVFVVSIEREIGHKTVRLTFIVSDGSSGPDQLKTRIFNKKRNDDEVIFRFSLDELFEQVT